MKEYTKQHKKAWEYNAYDFWVKNSGTPAERAKEDVANPDKMLRKYAQYFDSYKGIRIANICGSCGKKAIPLALLCQHLRVLRKKSRSPGAARS